MPFGVVLEAVEVKPLDDETKHSMALYAIFGVPLVKAHATAASPSDALAVLKQGAPWARQLVEKTVGT